MRAALLRWDVVRALLPAKWDVDQTRAATAAATGLSGWFYTSLFSGPWRGLGGAALWTCVGYAGQAGVDAAAAWRARRADAFRRSRAQLAALSPEEAAAVDARLQLARSERLHALRGAGAAAKIAAGAVPGVPSVDDAVADVVAARTRGGEPAVTVAPAVAAARAEVASDATAVAPPHALHAAPVAPTPPPAAAWLPIHRSTFGSGAGTAPSGPPPEVLDRLLARLRDVDERLGVPLETTERDIAHARGRARDVNTTGK